MKKVEVNLFSFEELSESAQLTVIERERYTIQEDTMDCFGYDYRATLEKFSEIFGCPPLSLDGLRDFIILPFLTPHPTLSHKGRGKIIKTYYRQNDGLVRCRRHCYVKVFFFFGSLFLFASIKSGMPFSKFFSALTR